MMACSMIFYVLLAVVSPRIGHAAVRSVLERAGLEECVVSERFAPNVEYFHAPKRVGALPSLLAKQAESDVTSAKLIAVEYGSHFKILTENMAKEQYILTQCGTPQPTDADVDAVTPLQTGYTRKHFTVPLQMAVAQSSVQLSFLEALGVQDRIGYVPGTASGPCWQRALGCAAQLESSWGGNATRLASQLSEGDAVFMDCTSTTPTDCSNVRAQTNGIHFSATQDSGPLHSAEHIKFIAAFFNKEVEADRLFTGAVHAYTGAMVQASPKPIVAWISYSTWPEASLVLSMATYKMRMVEAAGGANVDSTSLVSLVPSLIEELAVPSNPSAGKKFTIKLSSFNGSLANAAAAFFMATQGVDCVVDETYASIPGDYTFDSFLQNMGLAQSSNSKFVKHRQVFRIDGTISSSNQYDWYESRIAHPDWAVEGLARVIHGDVSKRNKYFRNLAQGEMPQVLTPSMCAVSLPVCNTSSYPATISMLKAPPVSTSTSSGSTSSGSAKKLGFAAALLSLAAFSVRTR